MKSFRNVLSLVLVFVLSISLVACGGSQAPAKNDSTQAEQGQTDASKADATQADATKADETKADATQADAKTGGEIHVYTRDASSGTREGFEKVIGLEGKLTDKANEVSSNGDMAKAVSSDVNGIGYVSLSTDFAANGLKPLKFEGVEPNVDNTVNGSYKMARPFCFATRAKGDYESQDKEDLVNAFMDFLLNSVEGREAVLAAGGIVNMDGAKPWDELAKAHPICAKDNSQLTIVTVGSTSVSKTLEAALESFQGLAGNFQYQMNQSGSGDGWKRVLGGEKDGPNKGDIGFASRKFKDDKEPTKDAMLSGQYCLDAIVVVVSDKHQGADNMSKQDLFDIFSGAKTTW